MPNPALLSTGVTILGGARAAKAQKAAAGDASAAQVAATQMAIAEQQRQFNLVRKLAAPYVQAGNAALQGQLDLLGFGGAMARNSAVQEFKNSPEFASLGAQARADALARFKNSDRYKMAGADRGKMLADFKGSERFKNLGAGARRRALEALSQDPRFNDASRQEQAISRIENGAEFKNLVQAGENAILTNASATGGLRGGNTQRALAEFRPQILDALINKQIGNLGGLAGAGQNAAFGLGQAAQNTGNQVAGLFGDRGAAQAGAALARWQAGANMWGGLAGAVGGLMGGVQQPKGVGLWDSWGF